MSSRSGPAAGRETAANRIRWQALVFGLSADFVATMIAGLLLSAFAGAILLAQNRPRSHIRELHLEPAFLPFVLAAMCGGTFSGGYVAGRTAGGAYIAHGVVMGLLSLLVGRLLLTAKYPGWFEFLANALALPAAVAGALLAAQRRPRTP
jgi:hypothetical protein